MSGRSLNEGMWRRGWNDTLSIWKSWPFIILNVVVIVVIAVFTWYWGLALIAFALFGAWLFATAAAPYKQRNEARKEGVKLRVGLGEVGYLDMVRVDGIELRNQLKRFEPQILDGFSCEKFKRWCCDVGEYLQKNMPDEYIEWYRNVDIDIDKASLGDVLKTYEVGLDILKGISERIISSVSHKEGPEN